MKEFLPTNPLEVALMEARSGLLPVTDFLRFFLSARIAVPSAAKVAADGTGFQPLEFTNEKTQILGCFTSAVRIDEFASETPFFLEMTGRQLLERMPPSYGVVINPGWRVGFDISPQGIAKILMDFVS